MLVLLSPGILKELTIRLVKWYEDNALSLPIFIVTEALLCPI